jgi:hypothetical protein
VVAEADVRVRLAEDLVVVALRFAVFLFRVAAAR